MEHVLRLRISQAEVDQAFSDLESAMETVKDAVSDICGWCIDVPKTEGDAKIAAVTVEENEKKLRQGGHDLAAALHKLEALMVIEVT